MTDKMKSTEKITKILFRAGMLDKVEEVPSCREQILNADEILSEIQQIFISDKLTELSGAWGEPEYGSPIQYHKAMVETDAGKSYEFEVYNLAIIMFHSEDEEIKRLFRFLVQIERHVKRHG